MTKPQSGPKTLPRSLRQPTCGHCCHLCEPAGRAGTRVARIRRLVSKGILQILYGFTSQRWNHQIHTILWVVPPAEGVLHKSWRRNLAFGGRCQKVVFSFQPAEQGGSGMHTSQTCLRCMTMRSRMKNKSM